jgi:hypothetical protein
MASITLNTAMSLTGLSKRTLWRRIADGQLRVLDPAGGGGSEYTRVQLEDVVALSALRLNEDDLNLIAEADAGSAEAQCDLGLLLLTQNHPTEAVAWFTRAANQTYPEAMHQLGRCYIAGRGLEANEVSGVEWISRAAALGHRTARPMARYLMDPGRPRVDAATLEARLDAIEREQVMAVLSETADGA